MREAGHGRESNSSTCSQVAFTSTLTPRGALEYNLHSTLLPPLVKGVDLLLCKLVIGLDFPMEQGECIPLRQRQRNLLAEGNSLAKEATKCF